LGGSLLIGAGAVGRFSHYPGFGDEYSHSAAWVREVTTASAGGQVLVGLGVLTLVILSVVGYHWITLTLVALLCVGSATFISGAALAGRLGVAFRHMQHHA
jgi:hypothetical protein